MVALYAFLRLIDKEADTFIKSLKFYDNAIFAFIHYILPRILDLLIIQMQFIFMNLPPHKWYRASRLMQTNPLANQPDSGCF